MVIQPSSCRNLSLFLILYGPGDFPAAASGKPFQYTTSGMCGLSDYHAKPPVLRHSREDSRMNLVRSAHVSAHDDGEGSRQARK
jgi:hypothetical protein